MFSNLLTPRTGSLSTGQGTRFVLAATEHLHRKIEKLTARIRQLEDALSKTQSQFSEHPHPLLDKELLDLDALSPNGEVELLSDQEDARTPAQPCNMHGTLSISLHGVSRFFGATGGCEVSIVFVLKASDSVQITEPHHCIRRSRRLP